MNFFAQIPDSLPGYIIGVSIFAAVIVTAALVSGEPRRPNFDDPEEEDRDEQP